MQQQRLGDRKTIVTRYRPLVIDTENRIHTTNQCADAHIIVTYKSDMNVPVRLCSFLCAPVVNDPVGLPRKDTFGIGLPIDT